MAKILVVEDNQALAERISDFLSMEKHAVQLAGTAADALAILRLHSFDLLILDWNLPDLTGLDICREYRSCGGKSPTLFLTANTSIDHKLAGLSAGADDYLTKPFDFRELGARVQALLRRPVEIQTRVLSAEDLTLDTVSGRVIRGDREIKLSGREYALLDFLMRHQGQLFSAEALCARVWPADASISPTSIRTYMTRLRARIAAPGESSLLKTQHGVGYKLEASDDIRQA